MTRLGDFLKLLVTNIPTKVAYLEKHYLLSKYGFGYFWATFGNIWVTFYFNIWSHCFTRSTPELELTRHALRPEHGVRVQREPFLCPSPFRDFRNLGTSGFQKFSL